MTVAIGRKVALCLSMVSTGIAVALYMRPSPDLRGPIVHDEEGEELPRLIQTIDVHSRYDGKASYTPSVQRLCEIGPVCLRYVLPLLIDESSERRMCAERVFREITAKMLGVKKDGMPHNLEYDHWCEFWKSMGDYKYDGPAEKRSASHRLWSEWLDSQNF